MERDVTQKRWAEFRAALSQAGIRWSSTERKRLRRETDLAQSGSGAEAMRSLLEAGRDFTAVFAFNDRTAIEAIGVIQASGLRVPQDIAVVGFNGSDYGELISPALTTVKQRDLGGSCLYRRFTEAFSD